MFKEEHFETLRKVITNNLGEHTADGTMKVYEALVNALCECNDFSARGLYIASSILSMIAQDHLEEKMEEEKMEMEKIMENFSKDTMN
jgi:hypothetical protein